MSLQQNYTTYQEDDVASNVTVTATQITIATLDNDTDTRVYKDFTANYFAADYEHSFFFTVTAASSSSASFYPWAVANNVGNVGNFRANDYDLHYLKWINNTLVLGESNGAADTTDTSTTLSLNTIYYIRMVRDEEIGTYGALYCHIYTDPEYTLLVDTLVVTLSEKKDLRYLYAMSGEGNLAGGQSISAVIQYLRLDTYPYSRKNLRTRIRDILNEDTASFWTDANINSFLDDGQREISSRAMCIRDTYAVSTNANSLTFSLGAFTDDVHKAYTVEYLPGGTDRPYTLRNINPKLLGHLPTDGVSPQFWAESQVLGSQFGVVDPIAATGSYNLKVYRSKGATDFVADSYTPTIPTAFQPLLINYALYQCYLKEQNYPRAAQFLSMYESELYFLIQQYMEPIPDSLEEYSMK